MRVFISVCEASADLHAASLLRVAARRLPAARFRGLTGLRMRSAGAETICDMSAHAAMLTGIWRLARRAAAARAAIARDWRENRPDAVVLMDSSAFHLGVARMAKRHGLPVLYYIAPQTWASRAYRNRRLARDVDQVACILPFEEPFLRAAGVRATYVGHPLFEALAQSPPDAQRAAAWRAAGRVLTLLPGSREQVIRSVLPLQLDVARRLVAERLVDRVLVSVAAADRASAIRAACEAAGVAAEPVAGDNASLIAAADLVLVASGTATLEVAAYRKPMIVMYDAGPLLAALYRSPLRRWVITTPHLALVNILAAARIVPEFMPLRPDPAEVARVAAGLLRDESWRGLVVAQLDAVVRPLEQSRPSERVCEMIAALAAGPRAT